VTEQRKVMADRGLALGQAKAEIVNVLLTFGQDQDELKPGRITNVSQEDRRATRLLFSSAALGAYARFRLGFWPILGRLAELIFGRLARCRGHGEPRTFGKTRRNLRPSALSGMRGPRFSDLLYPTADYDRSHVA
jgi:hypothetical protein